MTKDELSEEETIPPTTEEGTGTPPTDQDLANYPDIIESMNPTLVWQVRYKGRWVDEDQLSRLTRTRGRFYDPTYCIRRQIGGTPARRLAHRHNDSILTTFMDQLLVGSTLRLRRLWCHDRGDVVCLFE